MNFMESLKETINEECNFSTTENGAIGYKTSGKELLDLNFSVASIRNMPEDQIYDNFIKAYFENKALALRWLFYARDVRHGLGERRLFRVIMARLANNYPDIVKRILPLIPEYGRYDDLISLLDVGKIRNDIICIIWKQLNEDLENYNNGKPISLLAKWLPSINSSSKKTKEYAKTICTNLEFSERSYRKLLSNLREYIDVTERKMSSKNWDKINYEAVPSRANLIYSKAFLKNDFSRRTEYLDKLSKGETTINSAVLFPHDIVHKYSLRNIDNALEAMWKNLPDIVKGEEDTVVVADGSGSMCVRVDRNSSTTALDIAQSLAIYFAEHSNGIFKNKYITFSRTPKIVCFDECKTLFDKLVLANRYNSPENTNIEKVFDLILKTTIDNHASQKDIPGNILIISDMEFDDGVDAIDNNLFAEIQKRYMNAGFKLPRLVFWNVNSRTLTIPVKENDLGVALVSGFSVNTCKMVMSGKTDPYECLKETLMDNRYDAVEKAVSDLL